MRWQLRLGAQGGRADLDPYTFGVAEPGRGEYACDGVVIGFAAASGKFADSRES